jgi:hypothetical protein
MKKLLLTGAAILALTLTAKAQIITGTFNDTAALTGWTVTDFDGDTRNWSIFTGNATTDGWGLSGNFAGSNSWTTATGALTPDNFLNSPTFAVPATGATLNFLTGYTYYSAEDGPADRIAVYAVPEGTTAIADVIALTPIFVQVFDTETTEDSVPTAELKTVSLAAYSGQTISLAFRHYDSSNQELIFLDSVVVTEGVAGIDSVLANKFSVSPNPANNVVTIANADNVLVNAVSVTDMNGRVVKTAAFDGVAQATVNVSDLANGVYMMTISSDKGSVTKKIVKN